METEEIQAFSASALSIMLLSQTAQNIQQWYL